MSTCDDTVSYLREALQHAPQVTPGPPGLMGWKTPQGLYLCVDCAGRIMARGCRLPAKTFPVWDDTYGVEDPGPCVTCGRERRPYEVPTKSL